MIRFVLVPILVLAFSQPGLAAPSDGPDGRTLSPYFFVKSDDPATDRLPLKATSASVDIVGVIARVRVTQVYRNEGRRTLEAIYVFPGSTRAAVHGMKMTIGERVITARIEERQEARRQYNEARQSGRTASLLEQQRPNVFQMNVANILPGDEVKVELIYSELLVPERGVYEFVYPTVVGPRYSTTDAATAPRSERWVRNPYLHQGEPPTAAFDFQARIIAGMPLKHVGSPSHEAIVAFPSPSRASVSLPAGDASAANRDVVLRYQLADDRIETGLLLHEGADENFFVCMVEPPQRFAPVAIPPREYVFIVDVSGSMHGFPLDTSKQLLKNLLAKLRTRDYFNVLFFSGGAWSLSTTSLPATEGNKTWALQEIERQRGGGGTELLPALQQAFDLPRARTDIARSIVIATDGYVNVEQEAFTLVRDRLGDANVFAFGIGSSVNRHLIEGMARVGEGVPFVVLNPAEAPKIAGRFLDYIQSPLLTRVEVRTPGFDVYDLEPAHLPDLFAERPLVLVGKYRGRAAGEVVITGFTGQGRFERRVQVDAGRLGSGSDALRILWARERLSVLSDLRLADDGDAGRRQDIVRLGLKYGLLSEFTSFVAVDQRVRRQDGKIDTVKQPLPLPQGVSDLAVGGAPSQLGMAESLMVTSAAPAHAGPAGIAKMQAPAVADTARSRSAAAARPETESAAPRVEIVENKLSRSARWAGDEGQQSNRLKEAVARVVSGPACGARLDAVRLKISFNARGEVDRVEGVEAAAAACIQAALHASVKLAAVTGGYVVMAVAWR